jgi:hypothetical protein
MVVKSRIAIILCLALTACGAPPPRPSGPAGGPAPSATPPAPAPAVVAPPAATRYRIDAGTSELRVLVYRTGPMASLGHDHVISTHGLEGWATFDGHAATAAFALTVPVTDFVVDDPKLRLEEGADFAEDVTDEARSGTAHNMLGPAVLNAAAFPAIAIRSVAVTELPGSFRARVALEVAGHASMLDVPFVLEVSRGRLVAHGELALRQSAIGLTPFSVFLGALKVQDELQVKFRLTAVGDGA